MSERLPYEDHLKQHWTDLPLPDENKAWEDMRRRLEEDDDRPFIAWWRRGCLLWGLLLLLITGSGLWLIKKRYFKSDDKRKVTVHKEDQDSANRRKKTLIIHSLPSGATPDSIQQSRGNETGPLKEITIGQPSNTGDSPATVNNPGRERRSTPSTQHKGNDIKSRTEIQSLQVPDRKSNKLISAKNDNDISNPILSGGKGNRKVSGLKKKKYGVYNPVAVRKRRRSVNTSRTDDSNPSNIQKDNPNRPRIVPDQPEGNAMAEVPIKTNIPTTSNTPDPFTTAPGTERPLTADPVTKDTINYRKTAKKDSLSVNTAIKDSTRKKHLSYSAGISMQQLLPVAGQKTVPYNSQGRKGTLADYIPSIYFRVNKEQKWFIQGEFRYGAPQYTREFVYKQDRREDTSGSQTFTTRTSNTLKKTYYHQLPITFNYFVTKDWSIGAGVSWNKFVSAISDQEVTRRDNATALDSLVSKGIVREKSDSATGFAKSYFQGVIESQYKWKRFSFGARYTFGLQPYLKFTLLNGETGKESNRSLQLFLRYDLWQSKKNN